MELQLFSYHNLEEHSISYSLKMYIQCFTLKLVGILQAKFAFENKMTQLLRRWRCGPVISIFCLLLCFVLKFETPYFFFAKFTR